MENSWVYSDWQETFLKISISLKVKLKKYIIQSNNNISKQTIRLCFRCASNGEEKFLTPFYDLCQ